jgi:preprotein translocase subunit SecE
MGVRIPPPLPEFGKRLASAGKSGSGFLQFLNERGSMTTQAVKVKNEESQGNAITGAAAGVGQKVTGTVADTREFLHDVRVEMKQVTWPSREDVISTTWVVVATVAFFGVFLAVVDKLVQMGVAYVFKKFGI